MPHPNTTYAPAAEDDASPSARAFREDVLAGLRAAPKTLPCKYLYDRRGSQLFDAITELDEYYPTRTEAGIMRRHVGAMAERIGPRALIIEYGSGSSRKTRILLDALDRPAGYVPIDISTEHLLQATERLREAYPELPIRPLSADYTEAVTLPEGFAEDARRRVVYFPGSTIGNFEPDEAVPFLRRIARVTGKGGGLLIGVDLKKDRATLEAAYDDREGVTADFNKNLLRRINRELGAQFDLGAFAHEAVYNAKAGCVEMHLVSQAEQRVRVDGAMIPFGEGETIRTERSYKYTLGSFAALAEAAGFRVESVWTDAARRFSVQYLAVRQAS